MSNDQLKDYKKKLRLYEKLLELWVQIYGEPNQTTQGNDGPGTLPPPPPPPPPGTNP